GSRFSLEASSGIRTSLTDQVFHPSAPCRERYPGAVAYPRTHMSCREALGLIWVAMDAPRYELPEIPELADPGWMTVPAGPYRWASDSSRQLENFTDFGHFPWVHPGLL